MGDFEGKGGIGRVTSTIVNSFTKEDDVNIITVSYVKEKKYGYKINQEIKKEYLLEQNTSMTKAILLRGAPWKLRKIIREKQVDLIVACGVMFYPLAYLACIGTKTKCIYAEHTNPEVGCDFKFQRTIRKFSMHHSEKIIVISKSAREWYLGKGVSPSKIELICNAIPEEFFCSRKYDSNSKAIISVGRFSYQKNFEGLIDVALNFIKKYPQWTWDIYGDGEEYDKLSAKIKDLDLTEQVHLMGHRNDIICLYQKYAFVVMTSRYEGFPMTLIEAAANRLPMISYDVMTGPNEIIRDGHNGYLIEFENKQKMASTIESLICDESKRVILSENSFETSLSYKVDNIKKQWLDLFRRLA